MALIKHQNRQLHPAPPRHFKYQTAAKRNEILRKSYQIEAEAELDLMQREQRAGSMTPDPYRLLEFGMLTRPGEYTPECNQEPSTVDTLPPIFPGLDDIAASSDRRATVMVLALYLLSVMAAAWLLFGDRP